MFIKQLTIKKNQDSIIRTIPFHIGMNLIVDETVNFDEKETGNNVGKTTTLRLIDYCLGGSAKDVYTDPENHKQEYKLVKDYLIENNVSIELVLQEDLQNNNSKRIVIERNFLSRNKKIQKINGLNLDDSSFDQKLTNLIVPDHYGKKPSFRQLISHNIRHKDVSINNTLKNVSHYTSDIEYEALYLFLLGCEFKDSETKRELRYKINLEEKFKSKLEENQTKSGYETALSFLISEIDELEFKKRNLVVNPNFEDDFKKLNEVEFKINTTSSNLSELELKRSLIIEARDELANKKANFNLSEIKKIYEQASKHIDNIQKSFEELCEFHNKMIENKVSFISQELPEIESEIERNKIELSGLLQKEKKLTKLIVKSDSFDVLEDVLEKINEKYQRKGSMKIHSGKL